MTTPANQQPAVQLEGRPVTLRPMMAGDRERILAFARSLPSHELLFLRRDITRPEEVDAWIEQLRGGHLRTVLAVRDRGGEEEVLGYCVVDRSPVPWTRHVAELRVLVHPAAQGKGLGRLLTREAFRIATELGVEKMIAQMTTDQRRAINVFQNMGFTNEAVLARHVKDRDGRTYDLLVLAREVSAFESSVILSEP